MNVKKANILMELHGFGKDAVGGAIASGLSKYMPRKKSNRLDHVFIPFPEACGVRREVRIICDWKDGLEAHEVDCTVMQRFKPCRKWNIVN